MARQTNYGYRNGTSRAALLRSILEDYGHVVEVNSHTARQMLTNSIRRGIELGRLRTGVSTVQRNNLQYFFIYFPNSTSPEELLTWVPALSGSHCPVLWILTYVRIRIRFFRQWLTKPTPTRISFFPVWRIRDVYPGSRIRLFSIPDPKCLPPGSRIRTVSIPDPHQRI